jgi:hypothetical protein
LAGFRKVDEDADDPYEIDEKTQREIENEFVDQSQISKSIYEMKIPVLSDGFIPFGIALFFTYKRVHGDFKKMISEHEQASQQEILKKNAKIEIKNIVSILKREANKVPHYIFSFLALAFLEAEKRVKNQKGPE